MKKIILTGLGLFVFLQVSFTQPRGKLDSYEWSFQFSIEEAKDQINYRLPPELPPLLRAIIVQVDYPMVGYKVTYWTEDYQGRATRATGMVIFPENTRCPLPLNVYGHGAIFDRDNVPSNQGSDEFAVGLGFAGVGFVAALPDYLGMGDGDDDFHPFVEAVTEANAMIDLIRATRNLDTRLKDFSLSGQTFISGNSQGGHAGMAALKTISEDRKLRREIEIDFAGLGSGPYDLSDVQFNYIFYHEFIEGNEGIPYAVPGFPLYILAGCQTTFGNQYELDDNGLPDILVDPYNQNYVDEILGQTGNLDWLPENWKEMFVPEYLQAVAANPGHPLRACLEASDVYRWFNFTPTTMYYCTQDERVSFYNSLKTKEVQRDLIPMHLFWLKYQINTFFVGDYDHLTCAFPTLIVLRTALSLRRLSGTEVLTRMPQQVRQSDIIIPSALYFDAEVDFKYFKDRVAAITLTDLERQPLRTWQGDDLRTGKLAIHRGDLPEGDYGLIFRMKDQKEIYQLLTIRDPELAVSSLYDPIAPNPMKEEAILDLSLLDQDVELISVYDAGGELYQRYYPERRPGKVVLKRGDLPRGEFLVEVRTSLQSYFLPLTTTPLDNQPLNIFPNPMTTAATIDLTAAGGKVHSIKLFDLNGKLLRQYTSVPEEQDLFTLQRGDLPAGLYTVEILTDQGIRSVKLSVF